MSKFKLFIENFLVYGLGGILSKIIPLLMLPIITRLMPDTFYFGLNDLSITLVSFGSAIAIMGMYDAMFRMFFERENEEFKKDVCSSALIFTIVTSIIVFVVLFIFREPCSEFVFSDKKYANLLLLSAMSILIGTTNSIVAAPTRMQNKRKVYLVLNTLSPFISYSIAIPLLINGYFVIALPLASVIAALSLEIIFGVLNRKWFQLKRFNWKYLKQMLIIAIPLLPNLLIYWVFNSCDRLMIAKMLGNEFTGVYAVGAKIGHASQLIYTAFAGGWQYFAFSTMKENDQVKTNSLIFEYLGVISFSAGIFMAVLSKPIFSILFTGDYVQGYVVAPYLFLAPLLQMLFQVACNQFLVIKKTWPNMLILSVGVAINILINYFLIPVMGIEGAALATLIGYAVSDILCVIVLIKMRLMRISSRFIIATVILILFALTWRLLLSSYILVSLLCAIVITLIYIWLYRSDFINLLKEVKTSEIKKTVI
ncbi:oligosaccharide flippase family protein [Desulfosporosinus fructosivorans]